MFEIGISAAAVFFALMTLAVARLFQKNSKQNRDLIDFLGKQVEHLKENLARNDLKLETDAQRLADQSRRVAWLESRVRQPRISETENLNADVSCTATKSGIVDRRRQILTFAARGENAKKIASRLGMMPGEVELIINLNLNRVTA